MLEWTCGGHFYDYMLVSFQLLSCLWERCLHSNTISEECRQLRVFQIVLWFQFQLFRFNCSTKFSITAQFITYCFIILNLLCEDVVDPAQLYSKYPSLGLRVHVCALCPSSTNNFSFSFAERFYLIIDCMASYVIRNCLDFSDHSLCQTLASPLLYEISRVSCWIKCCQLNQRSTHRIPHFLQSYNPCRLMIESKTWRKFNSTNSNTNYALLNPAVPIDFPRKIRAKVETYGQPGSG